MAMQGDLTGALPHLKRAVALQPGDADMRHTLGRAWLALGRTDEATAQFNAALSVAPNHGGAREALDRLRRGGAPVP